MKRDNTHYQYHHTGIPTTMKRANEKYSAAAKMYTADHEGDFRIQWHRFEDDSPLHPLLRTLPHVAFKVNDLQQAIIGRQVILGPYEPIDDYWVAVIDDSGVPVELIQTNLPDEELWGRARRGEGSLYRDN